MTTPRRVFLHVGAPKTGTTYLQGLMFANREALDDEGVLLPGARWGRQVRAVQDVLGLSRRDPHIRRESSGAWQELVDEVHDTDHRTSVVSMEFLSGAPRRGVRRVVGSFPGLEVHVVVTARDMAGVVPAIWQTLVHNGATFSWEEFLDASLSWLPGAGGGQDRGGSGRGPRGQLRHNVDLPRIVRRWAPAVPAGRLHVVTVPRGPSDPTLLWGRFAEVLGLEPSVAVEEPADENASIGYASTELVRLVNEALPPVSRSEYSWTVKEHLALDVLARRSGEESRATLTAPAYDRALEWNAAARAAVLDAGAHVVGDLDDLPVEADPARRAALPDTVVTPEPGELLESAQVAVDGLAGLRARRARRLSRVGGEAGTDEHPPATGALERWRGQEDPVAAAVAEVADRCHELALMLREVRDRKAARG